MDSIKIKTVFGSKTVIFNLKVLTVAEENKIRASTFGLTEKEQEEKGFENIVSALAEFSATNPKKVIIDSEDGEREEEITVRGFFAEKTPATERIAHYAFRSWFVAMTPSIDFL